jgi:hypothetical protein
LGTQGVYLPGCCSRRYNTVAAFLRCCLVYYYICLHTL